MGQLKFSNLNRLDTLLIYLRIPADVLRVDIPVVLQIDGSSVDLLFLLPQVLDAIVQFLDLVLLPLLGSFQLDLIL